VGRKAPSAAPLLITLDQQSGRPIFQQVFDGVRDAILTGRLRRGQQVPSTRLLAGELGIARSTVVLAYEHLVAEGAPHVTRSPVAFRVGYLVVPRGLVSSIARGRMRSWPRHASISPSSR